MQYRKNQRLAYMLSWRQLIARAVRKKTMTHILRSDSYLQTLASVSTHGMIVNYILTRSLVRAAVQEIFETLCQCAALNPDSNDDGECQGTYPLPALLLYGNHLQYVCMLSESITCLRADDSDEGDFFYNEEEVLNGIGAENRAALLERYDALLEESEQPELEEVHSPCCIVQQCNVCTCSCTCCRQQGL